MSSEDPVPYDENAWERIVADLSDGLPNPPPPQENLPEPEEEKFVPPEPPALPAMDLLSKAAWAGTLGGPLLLFIGILAPGALSPAVAAVGVGAFVVGFLLLVLRHPNEPDDGWDDGSVV